MYNNINLKKELMKLLRMRQLFYLSEIIIAASSCYCGIGTFTSVKVIKYLSDKKGRIWTAY